MELPPFPVEWLDLPDDKLGIHLFNWWIGFQAERKGILPGAVTQEIAEKIRAATLGMDTDDARYTALEKALRRVATDVAGGGRLFRAHMRQGALHLAARDEAVSGKRRQRHNAKRPRPDALQVLILHVMEADPNIKQDQLLARLREKNGGGVIETISDAEQLIEWTDQNQRVQ